MSGIRSTPGFWDAFLGALVATVSLFLMHVATAPLFDLLVAKGAGALGQYAWSALVSEAGIAAGLAFVIGLRRLDWKNALGLARCRLKPTAWALMAVTGGGVLLDEVLHQAVSRVPSLSSGALESIGRALAGATPAQAVALVLPLAVAPALVEEALCRGLVLRGLAAGSGSSWGPVLVSSLFFGMLHLDRLHAPAAATMGVLLGIVAVRTRSLWPAVCCHLLNNLVSIFTPVFGGPDLATVLAGGHSVWTLVLAATGLVGGMVGLVRTTAKNEPSLVLSE